MGRRRFRLSGIPAEQWVAVPDEEILKSMKLIAEMEGIFAESSGVTCLAGLKKLVDEGCVDPGQKIVLLITGNGLKDVENARKVSGTVTSVEPDLDHVLKRLRVH